MCEPNHSIVQFPDRDQDDKPTGGSLDLVGPPTGTDGNMWDKLKKKVGDWFHFSCMGFGHSETLERMSTRLRLSLPRETKYEAMWWERKVQLDGDYHGLLIKNCSTEYRKLQEAEALTAATTYAHKVSIGSLTLFRQFLEWSVRKSIRPYSYVDRFEQMLTVKGRDAFIGKIRGFVGHPRSAFSRFEMAKDMVEKAIRIMLGFTRKRNLLRPEWADETSLWLPKTRIELA